MTNNDLLRRLRYVLNYSDAQMAAVFTHMNMRKSASDIADFLKREEEEGFMPMDDSSIGFFLDGLIIEKRGAREEKPGQKAQRFMLPRNNNDKLKKIRIAFNLKEEDMLQCFTLGDFKLSKSELSAMFRKRDHRNYSPCGDQAFRRFLNGLTEFQKNRNETSS